MLAGYVTYQELKIITGFSDAFLSRLISKGLRLREADLEYDTNKKLKHPEYYKETLFNLSEVEEWLKVHIF